MDNRLPKYLADIIQAISEIESATQSRGADFNLFMTDFVFRKFVERNIEIIGEAVNRILKIEPSIILPQPER